MTIGAGLARIDGNDPACPNRLKLEDNEFFKLSLAPFRGGRSPPDSQDGRGRPPVSQMPFQQVPEYLSCAAPWNADLSRPAPGRIPYGYAGHIPFVEILGDVPVGARTAPIARASGRRTTFRG